MKCIYLKKKKRNPFDLTAFFVNLLTIATSQIRIVEQEAVFTNFIQRALDQPIIKSRSYANGLIR